MTDVQTTPRSLNPDAIVTVEALRASHRPDRITTLFVGESPPVNGTFFYDGNNSMVRYMQRGVDTALMGTGDFLDRFRDCGWYLDDHVLSPINHLNDAERRTECYGALDSLSTRIAEYKPLAIVSLLSGIKTSLQMLPRRQEARQPSIACHSRAWATKASFRTRRERSCRCCLAIVVAPDGYGPACGRRSRFSKIAAADTGHHSANDLQAIGTVTRPTNP
jgi:hypothetical protein